MTESFVHLHVHSDYTLSKGASKVSSLVKRAAALKLPAMALVDEGNMYGAFEFSKYASGSGVQPIIGTKLWFGIGGKHKLGSVLLLAQSAKGYKNVCNLLSLSHRPREGSAGDEGVIPAEALEGDLEGVICLTGGRDGVLWRLLKEDRRQDAEDMLAWLRFAFSDRLYVELCRFGDEDQDEVEIERHLLDMAFGAPEIEDRHGNRLATVPIVGTTEVWYATEDKHDAYEILAAVENKRGVTVQDEKVVPSSPRRFHMRSAQEMRALFPDVPEAYENALAIPRRCSFMVQGRDPILPPFQTEEGRTEAEELRAQAWEGLVKRLEKNRIPEERHEEYRQRLEFELGIIESMKFPGYFLIVSDFIKWAKAQGIPVGPGRGSGAGSLVAYSLQITDLDPLPFGLLFERFLNPERVSMPDFDIDFCQDRREEVIAYVRQKYGTEYVSLIATFGEIKSKTAVKDVGRVMRSDDFGGYGFGELDQITKLMSMEGPTPKPLMDSYNDASNPEFKARIDSESKYRVLFENALKVEGLYRNRGSHAAGVVIGGQPLHELVPVGWDTEKQMPVCQFNMKGAESAGLVKFDFLGLKTLSVIREALQHIRETTGEDIDLSLLPLDDAPTYEMLSQGLTNGIFQFESDGMKKWMQALKPNRFEDLIAMGALYRPGPMDMIPHYVDCKNGKDTPNYPEPIERTKPFLEETFGIMVYQEQVMLVAQVVAGYSLGGADLLRRAMGKKIASEMAAQRAMFVEGATARGTSAEAAGELFDTIAKFAGYGFNKSHAAAYALIAYHTAYLKRHYPAQFLSALLTYETSSPERMSKIKEDMNTFGIEMLPPCVNSSFPRFRPEKKADGSVHVRFGLTAIKGISGELPILLSAREKGGKFKSLEDFHTRAGTQFNKAQMEKLAEAGAFDTISPKGRYSAVNVLGFLMKGNKKDSGAQTDLFGGTLEVRVPKEVSDVAEWGNVADREFNAVGFYFRAHPLDAYEARFKNAKVKRKASLRNWMLENMRAELKTKRLAGLVEIVERKTSKKGKQYVWAMFSEKNDRFSVNFFADPAEVESIRATLENAKIARRPVIVTGDLNLQEGRDDLTIWGRSVVDADEALSQERGRIIIGLDPSAVHFDLSQQRKLRESQESVRKGTMTESELAGLETSLRAEAFLAKIQSLQSMLGMMRNDDDTSATEVMLTTIADGQLIEIPMEGRYVIGVSQENAIKATDGVVSFKEAV